LLSSVFSHLPASHRDLHSFPTRRSSDLMQQMNRLDEHRGVRVVAAGVHPAGDLAGEIEPGLLRHRQRVHVAAQEDRAAALRPRLDRKSTRLNSSHQIISYAVFCLKKKKK